MHAYLTRYGDCTSYFELIWDLLCDNTVCALISLNAGKSSCSAWDSPQITAKEQVVKWPGELQHRHRRRSQDGTVRGMAEEKIAPRSLAQEHE